MTSREITREGPTDITDIQGIAEQQFFLLLKAKLPQRTTVDYESQIFISSNGGGRIEATVPDFIITKPNGVKIAIEITTENQNGTDPKEKQKKSYAYSRSRVTICCSIQRKSYGNTEKTPRI